MRLTATDDSSGSTMATAGARRHVPSTEPLTARCTIETPLGALLLARSTRGLAGAWFDGQKHHPGPLAAVPETPDNPLLAEATAQIAAYFANQRTAFDLPLDPRGTPFQRGVWAALQRIGTGATRSYGEVAREVGAPAAMRAVGAAIGRNPLSIVVPCHRVVGSGGALTGYAGGIDRKVALLRLEGARWTSAGVASPHAPSTGRPLSSPGLR